MWKFAENLNLGKRVLHRLLDKKSLFWGKKENKNKNKNKQKQKQKTKTKTNKNKNKKNRKLKAKTVSNVSFKDNHAYAACKVWIWCIVPFCFRNKEISKKKNSNSHKTR